MDLST